MAEAAMRRQIKEIMKLPVFLVDGHSFLCGPNPGCVEDKTFNYTFDVPDDVYIITFVIPGEYYCDQAAAAKFTTFQHIFKKYLLYHSVGDIIPSKKGGDKISLFSGIKRATGGKIPTSKGGATERVSYPNVIFDFSPNAGVDPNVNHHGVYRIDKFPLKHDHTTTLIDQGPGKYLETIIKESLKREGVTKGVFLLAGCYGVHTGTVSTKNLTALQHLVELADKVYPSLKPTVTKEEVVARDWTDLKLFNVPTYEFATSMVDPREIYSLRKLISKEDLLEGVVPKFKEEILQEYTQFKDSMAAAKTVAKTAAKLEVSAEPNTGAVRKGPRTAALKTMKQRIQHSKSATRNKSKARLLERVKRDTGKLPAWARNWLKRYRPH